MPYLLDADWAINALAGRPAVVAALRQLAPDGIAITWITVGEIYEGAFYRHLERIPELKLYRPG
jgi:predicted nucleic acid-binding protein